MDFVFSDNVAVDDIGKVPEQFRGVYAQGTDGKYVLGDAFKGVATAVDGLNKALRGARKDADVYKKNAVDLSPLGQLLGIETDVTPDAVRTSVQGLLDKLAAGDQGKVNWDKMRQQLELAHARALEGKDGELGKMRKSLERHLVTSEATRAIAANKGVTELLLPHIQGRTRVVLEGDEFITRVVDEAGDPRGNGAGGFMTIEDLVKELKASPTFGRAFESEATSGSGPKPNAPGGPRPSSSSGSNLSATAKIARGLAARRR